MNNAFAVLQTDRCPAREQQWYDEKGQKREQNNEFKVVDKGNEGKRLGDFRERASRSSAVVFFRPRPASSLGGAIVRDECFLLSFLETMAPTMCDEG